MRNITITVQEDVARWARIWAAEHEISVSKLLGSVLQEKMKQVQGYNVAMQQNMARQPKVLKKKGSYPKRKDLHERDRIC